MALVLKRTIPTERKPLVGEISANVCRYTVLCGQSFNLVNHLFAYYSVPILIHLFIYQFPSHNFSNHDSIHLSIIYLSINLSTSISTYRPI
jgi:hypothetical protein